MSEMSEGFEQQYQDRVTGCLDALSVYVAQAEKAKDSGKDAARMLNHLTETWNLFAMATEPNATVLDALASVGAELQGQAGADRTDGDQLAAKVRAMLSAGIDIDAEISGRAEALLGRWTASTPKGASKSRSSGSGSVSEYIPVEWRCSCGWVGHDKSNPNSARWAWLKHFAGSSHSVRDEAGRDGRVGKDHPLYAALTNALTPVMKGTETRVAVVVDGVGELVTIVDPR